MTYLYRSPNIRVDNALWHVVVSKRPAQKGVTVLYRFRRVDEPNRAWQQIAAWPGRKPKGLKQFFRPFRHSIAVASAQQGVAA